MQELKRSARFAGLAYLALGITGMIGFLALRPQLYIADDAAATLDNLVEKSALAHVSVTLELLIVIAQALAAVYFYKLFASVNRGAAVSIMAFGLMNSVTILASAGFMATAVGVAGDQSLAPGGDAAATVGLLALLSTNAWAVGNVFFGLWLIPMGWVVITSGRMPKPLGWILIAGGAGYLLSAIVGHAWADAPKVLIDSLPLPATVGEFWMIGYLLVKGIRPEVTR
jgi:hypothetical protein